MARRPRRLRTHLAVTICVVVIALTTASGVLSYFTTRHFLIVDQQHSLETQAFQQASAIERELRTGISPATSLDGALLDAGQTAGLYVGGSWYLSGPLHVEQAFSPSIRAALRKGQSAVQTTKITGYPYFVVAVSIGSSGDGYLLSTNLANLQHTLSVLFGALLGTSIIIVSLGALAGAFAARRSMAPLKEVSQAAQAIARGDLTIRLPDRGADPDLGGLSTSFNEMAEHLSERIERDSRFASDVSHEMRSPLTSMIGALNVVQRTTDDGDPRSREALALFAAEVRRFEKLLQDLIELARLDGSKTPLTVEQVTVGELLNQSVASFQRNNPGVVPPLLTLTGDAADIVIAVDKRRFERIVGNLLENAAQYGNGCRAIIVAQSARGLVISISDAGPGITASDLPRVFERFYRGSAAGQRRSGEGSGLGLAIVATQVQHLHGTIELTNNDPGPGLTATLVLPIVDGVDGG